MATQAADNASTANIINQVNQHLEANPHIDMALRSSRVHYPTLSVKEIVEIYRGVSDKGLALYELSLQDPFTYTKPLFSTLPVIDAAVVHDNFVNDKAKLAHQCFRDHLDLGQHTIIHYSLKTQEPSYIWMAWEHLLYDIFGPFYRNIDHIEGIIGGQIGNTSTKWKRLDVKAQWVQYRTMVQHKAATRGQKSALMNKLKWKPKPPKDIDAFLKAHPSVHHIERNAYLISPAWTQKRVEDHTLDHALPPEPIKTELGRPEQLDKIVIIKEGNVSDATPFIPAFRKYNSIELATAIGSWDGKGVHAGLPKGHTGNGIVTVVTAVPLPPDRYRVWTRPVVVVENAAPRMSTIAQLQGLDEAAGTEADEGSSEHGRDLEAEPESPATEPLFLKDEEDHGSNSSHRSPSPEQQPTRRRRLTKRNRTTSPVPSVAAATPTRAGRHP
ncbi:hypothetical protein SISSUDRAFT_1133635 [Sistotremastrum suecicum HHB10207 ss-3]|uniref:Uncharacterized protein n=1 Tax=Sistotremastrum suecicum HHB10207 ss-3 TaxID=1314776 RepID=A0A165WHI8_9AGAM|nr:hypothetical protein SISSUDRAFT_1133635 [Sistotremastrum suecicum HHB10207 ss-3]